jgi:two-component system, sensor histidine kinase and response regulator
MTAVLDATAPARPAASPGSRPAVFVIDDDEVMLLSCRKILEKDGYTVQTFESGSAGLARLAEERPQLVLVDLKMPELDGLQVIARIRAIDPDLVIAVITGYATITTAVDAMKSGAYDFLPKPFTPDELRLVVSRGCERWQLAHESARLRQEKEAAERRVITFVSHQLKSPLAAAKQYLDVLLYTAGEDFSPTTVDWIGRAQARLDDMLAMIDDWLTLAHAERGTLGQRGAAADPAAIIEEVVRGTAPQAGRAHVTVTTDLEGELPAVRGDAVALGTVLANLVSNAIKYNRPDGEVRICARVTGGSVRVEVSDTGLGIAAEHLPRVFEEFYRISNPETQGISGTGLGLSICRRVMTELGGTIHATSTLGEGSTFAIEVPLAADTRTPES